MCVGHRCLRQDDASMGSHHRTMCHDHGHSLGDLAPSNRFIAGTLWFILPWNHTIRRKFCRSYSTICRRHLGNVPRLYRCSTVLGVRARQWKWGWRSSIVGQSVFLALWDKSGWMLNCFIQCVLVSLIERCWGTLHQSLVCNLTRPTS